MKALNVLVELASYRSSSALNIQHMRGRPKYPDDVNTPVSPGAAGHLLYKQRRAVEAAVLLAKQDWQRAADASGG